MAAAPRDEAIIRRSARRPGVRVVRRRPSIEPLEDRRLLSGAGALVQAYGRLPLAFEANAGQADGQASFLARGPGYALFLTDDTAVLSLRRPDAAGPDAPAGVALRMRLV